MKKYRPRTYYTEADKAKMWDHYLKVNEANPKRLSAEQVRLIRSLTAEDISVEEIMTEVGALNETQVKNVIAGRTYQRVH